MRRGKDNEFCNISVERNKTINAEFEDIASDDVLEQKRLESIGDSVGSY